MSCKRGFDIFCSITALIIFFPVFIIMAVLIMIDSKGGVFYKSTRIGQHQRPFTIFKFRTMYPNSDHLSITVGKRDSRITRIGYWLRKYKLDELPQLVNVLAGQMSIVGPRPDVPYYAKFYIENMPEYYNMKPGITSYSSIYFSEECEVYSKVDNPEQVYINETIPKKVQLDKKYYYKQNLANDFAIIAMTLKKLLLRKN